MEPSRKSSVELAKEEIICPLCMDIFDNPRSLQCLHSYCEKCLYGLHKSTLFAGTIACPECRANTVLPTDGIKGLKLNFKLKRFSEILSAKEKKEMVRVASLRRDKPTVSPSPLTCNMHDMKPLEFYCEQCKVLVCGQCVVDVHRMHKEVKNADQILQDRIKSLSKCTAPVPTLLTRANSTLRRLRAEEHSIQKAAEEDTSRVQTYFSELRSILEEREKTVCRKIQKHTRRQQEVIDHHKQVLHNSMEDVHRSKLTIEDVIERRKDDVRVLVEEQNLKEKLDSHLHHLEMIIKKAKEGESLVYHSPFILDPSFEAQCRVIGLQTDAPSPIHMPRHRTLGTPPIKARYSALSKIRHQDLSQSLTTETTTHEDFPSTKRLVSVGSLDSGSSDICSTSDVFLPELRVRPSTYVRSVDATIITPSLVINSSHIIGKLTTAYPCGVCTGNCNTLIVADSKNHMFSILTPTGKCLESIATEGKGDGQFTEPTAVVTDEAGNILVLDKGAPPRVQKFSDSGRFLSKFKVRGGLPYGSLLGEPLGLAVLRDGSVLVSDSEKSCVHIYEENGKYQGKFGDSDLQLRQPAGIAVDSRGNVIIADRGNHCLLIYTCGGHYVSRAGKQGSCQGELLYPFGVVVDKDGNMFVSECGNHRISVFSAGGKFVRSFGKKGSEPGMFLYPRHLCIDSQGRLVVADEHNQRVQIFDIDNK